MRFDIYGVLFAIRSSFWLIPSILSLSALVLALLVTGTDLGLKHDLTLYLPEIAMPIESARMVLSTIAGSMITIATLVFSMTLVALTMVSQQLGPRILLRFMDDREIQLVLGLFIATFLFALIVLMRLGNASGVTRSPGIGVLFAAGLAILAVGMMIRFIHHIATRIQADVLIAELGEELNRAANEFLATLDEDDASGEEKRAEIDGIFDNEKVLALPAERSGYLNRIFEAAGCELARKYDAVLRIEARPGDFVISGSHVVSIAFANGKDRENDNMENELTNLLAIDKRRTPAATVEFEIKALTEVALRALSPGVNDPYTAVACIDRLADGLRILMRRKSEQRVTRDKDGKICIVHAPEPFSRYLSIAFDAISEAAGPDRIALPEMRYVIEELESLADSQSQRSALRRYKSKLKPPKEDKRDK